MASKKKKSTKRRNPRATSKFNKATGKWESTGVVRAAKKASRKKASRKKASRKKASRKKASSKHRNPPGVPMSAWPAGKKKSAKKASRKKKSGSSSRPTKSQVSVFAKAIAKEVQSCLTERIPFVGGGRRSASPGRSATSAGRKVPSSCKKTGKKRVKCDPRPTSTELDACALAAKRHGKKPSEVCGTGVKRPVGRALAKHRWSRLMNPNAAGWDD